LPICTDCLASFPRISGCVCLTCGLPLDILSMDGRELEAANEPQTKCECCRDDSYQFDRARSFARYQDSLVRAIVLLKFEEIDPLADWFADRLAEVVVQASHEMSADVIVPVPLHKDRHRERGFNQAELLSKRLAKRLRLPHPGRSSGQKTASARQTPAQKPRALGGGSWRFCHTSGQPS